VLIKARWEFELGKLSKSNYSRDFYTSILKDSALINLKNEPVKTPIITKWKRLEEIQLTDNSNGFSYVQNGILYIYGDALSVIDKSEVNFISAISFSYITVEKLAPIMIRLRRFNHLDTIEFNYNNIYSLKQVNFIPKIYKTLS
jgi:hypothetical protein